MSAELKRPSVDFGKLQLEDIGVEKTLFPMLSFNCAVTVSCAVAALLYWSASTAGTNI